MVSDRTFGLKEANGSDKTVSVVQLIIGGFLLREIPKGKRIIADYINGTNHLTWNVFKGQL